MNARFHLLATFALSAGCSVDVADPPETPLPHARLESDAGGAEVVAVGDEDVLESALIVFSAKVDGSQYDIYSIHPDGTALTRLVDTADASELSPSWSPDRSKISLVTGGRVPKVLVRDTTGALTEVPVPQPAAGTVINVTSGDRDRSRSSWSSDGKRIAFTVGVDLVSCHPGSDDCFGIRSAVWTTLDGASHDFARDVGGRQAYQSLSPLWDGSTIRYLVICDHPACASYEWMFGSDHDPAIYPPYGRAASQFTHMGDLDISSSRGRWAFTASDSPLWVGDAVVVCPSQALTSFHVIAEQARSPRWSPTEQHIAFLRDDGIYVMRPDGSRQHRIFEGVVHSLDW